MSLRKIIDDYIPFDEIDNENMVDFIGPIAKKLADKVINML